MRTWIVGLTARYTVVLWMCVVAVVGYLALLLTVPIGTTDEDTIALVFYVQLALMALVGCAGSTYLVVSTLFATPPTLKEEAVAAAMRVMAVYPLAAMVVSLAWVQGGLWYGVTSSKWTSALLVLLLDYGALLIGVLIMAFVALPFRAAARGLWGLTRGEPMPTSGYVGLFILSITTLILTLVISTPGQGTGRVAVGVFYLVVLFGGYSDDVERPVLLWIARAIVLGFLLLIARSYVVDRRRSGRSAAQDTMR